MKNGLHGVVLAVAVLSFGCSGGDDEASECTTAIGEAVAVGASAQCTDIGNFFSGVAICRSDGQFDTSGCSGGTSGNNNNNAVTDTPEFGLCNVGSTECVDGTDCVTIASGTGTTIGACGEACDPQAASDTCPMGRACENVDSSVSGGLCLDQIGERNDYCGLSLSPLFDPPVGIACTGDLECTATINFGQECKDRCDPDDIGTSNNCGGSDSCLPSGRIEIQEDMSGDSVNCPTPGSPTGCDAGFTCRGFRTLTDDGADIVVGSDNICVRSTGRCGSEAPVVTDFTTSAIQGLSQSEFCGLPNQDVWCPAELAPGSGASIECTGSGFLSVIQLEGGATIPCNPANNGFDCPVELGATCVPTSSGNVCGFSLTVCAPFCEDSSGQTQFDCGPGFTCDSPTVDMGDYVGVIFERDMSNNIVLCPDGNECGIDFTCEDLFSDVPPSCVRNRRMCIPS